MSVADHVATYHGEDVRLEEQEGCGRILVAARDFDAGERILLEYPLVHVVADQASPAYSLVQKLHSEGALEFSPVFYWAALCSLTVSELQGARCTAWPTVAAQTQEQILQLHAPEDACNGPSDSIRALAAGIWEPGTGPDLAHLDRLFQSWVYNAFDSSTEDDKREAAVLFFTACMQNHSCGANAAWHLDEENSYILHARRDIEEGDEINVPYLSPADLCLPTSERRAILRATKDFWCGCGRCTARLDSTRVFICPTCRTASVFAENEDEATPSSCSTLPSSSGRRLSCKTCGLLADDVAAPLLAFEAGLHPWARSRSYFYRFQADDEQTAVPDLDGFGGSPDEALRRCADEGLAEGHWIVDVLRAVASETSTSVDARRELLQQRVKTLAAAGSHCLTRLAHVRLKLGESLLEKEDDSDALKEAVSEFDAAASTFATLFGDDHPEHLQASARRGAAARRLAALKARQAAPAAAEGGYGTGRAGVIAAPAVGKRAGGRRGR
eukprot:TRINITY_DN40891_c0_g1_i2.p1 TRINITY_DN40891_c0_g1~~TRINITY_DN40891_c0_g1_i2.p1  ORF type:complete len:500 (-),score=93.48 TRINITY_DN40891_c0_g1_i2:771-2270(-)